MIDRSLEQLQLWKALDSRRKKDSFAGAVSGLLTLISGDARELLEYVRFTFPNYTRHNVQHSFAILHAIERLAPAKKLSSAENFIIIMAALFHDAGMVASAAGTAEDVRRQHHVRGRDFVLKYFQERLSVLSDYARLAQHTSFVIEAHGLDWEVMVARPEFSRRDMILGHDIRPGLLAVLLRIGDLLDLDSDRSCDAVTKLRPEFFTNAVSLSHHVRHKSLRQFVITESSIKIHAVAASREEHQIWHQWFSWLKGDIEKASTYVFTDELSELRFPPLISTIDRVEGATYDIWPLRFEIDKSGRVWELLAHSVYTGRFDFVRELVQNAIDASLAHIYCSADSQLSSASPRRWALSGYHPCVTVVMDEERGVLSILDNGIGMDRQELQKFLFTVAQTGFSKVAKDRKFPFSCIARFGVGFISVIARAQSLRLETKSDASPTSLAVVLQDSSADAYVEQSAMVSRGTQIRMRLKHATSPQEVERYVSETFSFASVPILYVDATRLRRLVDVAHSVGAVVSGALERFAAAVGDADVDSAMFSQVYQETELLSRSLVSMQGEARDRIAKEKSAKSSKGPLLSSFKELHKNDDDDDDDDCDSDDGGSDTGGGSSVYGSLGQAADSEEQAGEDFWGTVESTFLQERQTRPPDSEIAALRIPHKSMSLVSYLFSRIVPADAVVVGVDDDGMIRNIRAVSDGASQGGARGVVWVPVYFCDYSLGVEWQSMHGFIVSGDLVVRMVVLDDGRQSVLDAEILRTMSDDIVVSEKDDVDTALRAGHSFFDPIRSRLKKYNRREMKTLGLFPEERRSRNRDMAASYEELVRPLEKLKGNIAFQDGVRLPFAAWKIAPVGACRAQANLTAGARLPLNITRGSLDESPTLIGRWWEDVGGRIQGTVLRSVADALNALDVTWNADDVVTGIGDSPETRDSDHFLHFAQRSALRMRLP